MRIHYLKLRRVNILGQRTGGKRLWVLPLCWYLNHSLEAPGQSLSLLLAELLTIHFHPCLLHELPSQVTANQILVLVSTGNRYKTINSIQPYCQIHHIATYITTAANAALLKESAGQTLNWQEKENTTAFIGTHRLEFWSLAVLWGIQSIVSFYMFSRIRFREIY